MEYLESIEVRWFLDGGDPRVPLLDRVFQSVPIEDAGKDDETRRYDHYFRTGRADLGVKVRHQRKGIRFETKYLAGSFAAVALSPSVVGDIERWNKCSVVVSVDPQDADPRWVSVKKERRLRKFSRDSGAVTEVSVEDYPASGCGVELTTLEITRGAAPRTLRTLGLEAFGPSNVVLAALQETAQTVFAEMPELRLGVETSKSYAAWLAVLPATAWTHRVSRATEYYDHPAQGRPPNGTLRAGTLCMITSSAGSYTRVATDGGVSGYVATDALAAYP